VIPAGPRHQRHAGREQFTRKRISVQRSCGAGADLPAAVDPCQHEVIGPGPQHDVAAAAAPASTSGPYEVINRILDQLVGLNWVVHLGVLDDGYIVDLDKPGGPGAARIPPGSARACPPVALRAAAARINDALPSASA
jgi:hypothetical protein